MGCCVSKKRGAAGEARPRSVEARDMPPPEEEKVKEVLSETPSIKPRPKPRRVAGAVVPSVERGGGGGGEKAKGKGGSAMVKDGGRASRAVGFAHAAEEKSSEAASESSAATTAAGPERSPAKPPRRRGPVSGELGRVRRERDRAAAVPGAGRPGGRASPSPPPQPPRRDPGERLGRRSPSPAAKRSQDQRRAAAASCTQRKPPVPARPCGRASPRRAQEAPPQLSAPLPAAQPHGPTLCASPPSPQARAREETTGVGSGGAGDGDGEGKESLENPLVSMECFIFL